MMISRYSVVTLILLTAVSFNLYAKTAGTTKFAVGKVTAKGAAKDDVRILSRGTDFLSGDTVDTGLGRAQLRFLDGSFVSLQPATVFHVDDYQYRPGQKTGNSLVIEVVKGGLRMVTGAIGKQQPEAVAVKTPVATIGIRGTGFTVRLCRGDCSTKKGGAISDGLYSCVTNGKIIVKNKAGELLVPSGKNVFVKDDLTAPSFTESIPLNLPKNTASHGSKEKGEVSANPDVMEEKNYGADSSGNNMPVYRAGEQIGPNGINSALPLDNVDIIINFPN